MGDFVFSFEINYFSIDIGIYSHFAMLVQFYHFDCFIGTLESDFFLILNNYLLAYLQVACIILFSFQLDFDIDHFIDRHYSCFHYYFTIHFIQNSFLLLIQNCFKFVLLLYLVKPLSLNQCSIRDISKSLSHSFARQHWSLSIHFLYHFYYFFLSCQWSHRK